MFLSNLLDISNKNFAITLISILHRMLIPPCTFNIKNEWIQERIGGRAGDIITRCI